VTMRPLMSLPMASVRRERAFENVSDSSTSRRWMVSRSWFALNADRALACHAFDEDALGAHREAEIFSQASDAAIFHARLG